MECILNHAGFIMDKNLAMAELNEEGYEPAQVRELLDLTQNGEPYTDSFIVLRYFQADQWFIARHTPSCGANS